MAQIHHKSIYLKYSQRAKKYHHTFYVDLSANNHEV